MFPWFWMAYTSLMTTVITFSTYVWICHRHISWWCREIKTFSALLVICAGDSPVPGEFPAQSQWRGALMFSLICVWTNGSVNNREAGGLRRHRAHYDVIVMVASISYTATATTATQYHSDNTYLSISNHTQHSNISIFMNFILANHR